MSTLVENREDAGMLAKCGRHVLVRREKTTNEKARGGWGEIGVGFFIRMKKVWPITKSTI